MRKWIGAIAGGCAAVLAFAPAWAGDLPAAHQVFVDYHVPRFTRLHDGANGVWQFAGTAAASRLADTAVIYNPDLIDEKGRNEIAATSYPLAGMQSDLDPDYLEYQVLSAKEAHIDGFMVEWGAPGHAGNAVLLALEAAAQKYGLKVGVNWCVGWAKQGLPASADREAYLKRLDAAADYLQTTLYAAPNAARFGDRPVVMIFGGDLTDDEFHRLKSRWPDGVGAPLLLRQGMVGGNSDGGHLTMRVVDTDGFSVAKGFTPDVGGYFGWVPARLRHTTGAAAKWDRYATTDDTPDYLKALQSLPVPDRPFLRMASASPGFDNRPSAGWNKNDLSSIPRGQGEVYDAMWRYDLAHQAQFDWVLIPTWNDWTEGSQIEPSEEDQGAALAMTAHYTAALKHMTADPEGLSLPLRLFRLRKGWERVEEITGAPPAHVEALDAIAQAISDGDTERASRLISAAEADLAAAHVKLSSPQHIVLRTTNDGLTIVKSDVQTVSLALPATVAEKLRHAYFDAVLAFDYRAPADTAITIRTTTARTPSAQGDYAIVAQIKTKASPDWKPAKVRIYAQNATFGHALQSDGDIVFRFSQPVDLSNLTLTVDLYH